MPSTGPTNTEPAPSMLTLLRTALQGGINIDATTPRTTVRGWINMCPNTAVRPQTLQCTTQAIAQLTARSEQREEI